MRAVNLKALLICAEQSCRKRFNSWTTLMLMLQPHCKMSCGRVGAGVKGMQCLFITCFNNDQEKTEVGEEDQAAEPN